MSIDLNESSTTQSVFKDEKFIDHLRKLVKDFLAIHSYETALFWADKITTLVRDSLQDFYIFLHCLYCCGQYQRVISYIKQNNLHQKNLLFRYLAAKCHFVCKEYDNALDVLDYDDFGPFIRDVGDIAMFVDNQTIVSFVLNERNIESAIFLLKGQIHEALGCSDAAIECYKNALHADVYCYEALNALLSNHMLTPKDENALLATLPIQSQCKDKKEIEFLKYIYANKLSHPNKQCITFEQQENCKELFKENLDILTSKAERLYYDGDFDGAYVLCRKVLEKDQFHKKCVPLYVSTLVHLNKVTQLFEIAHILVKQYPQDAASWFAVGCYYFLIGNMDPARKFFLKATCLNRSFSPAWLALGHSFAQESEHDQATSAYFTAAQIMKGSILPHLYIGLEYTLSNNLKLAERFYQQALKIECDDPFVLHELGVIWFKSQNYQNAESSMKRALDKLTKITNKDNFKEWEPLFNNLGHVCRKLKKYNESLEFHRKALSLYPTSSSTWASIGLTSIFLNRFDEAIEYFHQALWHKKQDLVAKKLLDKCLNLVKDQASIASEDIQLEKLFKIIGGKQVNQSMLNTSTFSMNKTGATDNESAMELVVADDSDSLLIS